MYFVETLCFCKAHHMIFLGTLFDARDGLQKLLDILNVCTSGSGGDSGGLGSSNVNQGNDRSPAEVWTSSEKQVAYHTGVALRQYLEPIFFCLLIPFGQAKASVVLLGTLLVLELVTNHLTLAMRLWKLFFIRFSETESLVLLSREHGDPHWKDL
jgi:hypothetical protein